MQKLITAPENVTNYGVISDNIRKVYPERDGNPEKLAVRGLSLAIPHGECFGLLGSNGAGKTFFISMVCTLLFFPLFIYPKLGLNLSDLL